MSLFAVEMSGATARLPLDTAILPLKSVVVPLTEERLPPECGLVPVDFTGKVPARRHDRRKRRVIRFTIIFTDYLAVRTGWKACATRDILIKM
jgi:hypothetical protein